MRLLSWLVLVKDFELGGSVNEQGDKLLFINLSVTIWVDLFEKDLDLLFRLLVVLEKLDDLLVSDFATVIDIEIGKGFLEVLTFHELVVAEAGYEKLCVLDLATAVCVYDIH